MYLNLPSSTLKKLSIQISLYTNCNKLNCPMTEIYQQDNYLTTENNKS